MIRLKKTRKPGSIPLASMGDIAFLLMIFYMATTLVTDQKPLELSLPEVESENKSSPYPLIIYMDGKLSKSNHVYFFNQSLTFRELREAITVKAAEAPAAVRVYLNIQKDVPYEKMDSVIKELKEAGIRNLIITTIPPAGG